MTHGAKALIDTLLNAGIDTCFTNPGTSEMHFVATLDSTDMQAVLCLFEGVATGAADGYARMTGKPAATLLHLGCGLGNGLANLHNARKARVPMINIVGDHATYHTQYDAQLQSDIETVARNCSTWVRTTATIEKLSADTAEAIAVAIGPPAQIATLILPADVSWRSGTVSIEKPPAAVHPQVDNHSVEKIAEVLESGTKTALLLGGRVLCEEDLCLASQIAEKTDVKLLCEVFPTRLQRGAGIPQVERIAYLAEMASVQLDELENLILVDTKAPVSFFAYPGKKSYLVPEKCKVHNLVTTDQDAHPTLLALANAVGALSVEPNLPKLVRPDLPDGKLTAAKVCQAIGALIPEDAIISDEAQTSGVMLPAFTANAPKHDLLTLTGGAIGQGLPVAIGAAVACPDRPVLAVVGDGSAMYTSQALWTIVNQDLNITVVIMNNRSYAILNVELERVGAKGAGTKAKSQLDLSEPPINFVALANSMGMTATSVSTARGFNAALENAFSNPGPHLIEAIVPSVFKGLKLKAMPHVLGALDSLPVPLAKVIKNKVAP